MTISFPVFEKFSAIIEYVFYALIWTSFDSSVSVIHRFGLLMVFQKSYMFH
jgi:hypothetical protein